MNKAVTVRSERGSNLLKEKESESVRDTQSSMREREKK